MVKICIIQSNLLRKVMNAFAKKKKNPMSCENGYKKCSFRESVATQCPQELL